MGKGEVILRWEGGELKLVHDHGNVQMFAPDGSILATAQCEMEIPDDFQEALEQHLLPDQPGDERAVTLIKDGYNVFTYTCSFEIHHSIQEALNEELCRLGEDEDAVFWSVDKFADPDESDGYAD